jgi:hypothetical protein
MPSAYKSNRPVGRDQQEARIRVDFSELVDAATAQTLDLVTLPTGAQVDLCVVDLLTTFADAGAISDVTVEVGTAADPDAFVTSTDIFGATAGQYRADGANPSASKVAIKAKFTATGDNFGNGSATALDSGSVDFVIRYTVL